MRTERPCTAARGSRSAASAVTMTWCATLVLTAMFTPKTRNPVSVSEKELLCVGKVPDKLVRAFAEHFATFLVALSGGSVSAA